MISSIPILRNSVVGVCLLVAVSGGFLIGASVRPTRVEAQTTATTPTATLKVTSKTLTRTKTLTLATPKKTAGAAKGVKATKGVKTTKTISKTAVIIDEEDKAPVVAALPVAVVTNNYEDTTVGIPPAPSFSPPPYSAPATFLVDPRTQFVIQMLQQSGVPLRDVLNPRSTARPSFLIERLISFTQSAPTAMNLNLETFADILNAQMSQGGDARYIQKLTHLRDAVVSLQTAITSTETTTTTTVTTSGGPGRGSSGAPATQGRAGASGSVNLFYIGEARGNARLADTCLPS